MKTNNLTTIYIIATLLAFSVYGILHFADRRDKQIVIKSTEYETCVIKKYNMTPNVYLEINGEYPVCE